VSVALCRRLPDRARAADAGPAGRAAGLRYGGGGRARQRPTATLPVRCYPKELTITEVVSTAGSPDWSWGTLTYTVPVQLSLPSETVKEIR
jgi:hypothetical protein